MGVKSVSLLLYLFLPSLPLHTLRCFDVIHQARKIAFKHMLKSPEHDKVENVTRSGEFCTNFNFSCFVMW